MEENSKVTLLKDIAASDLNENSKDEAIKQFLVKDGDENGMLDKFFGKNHPEIYIGLIIVVLLAISGMLVTCIFRDDKEFVRAIWTLLAPAITGSVGYMFGANKK